MSDKERAEWLRFLPTVEGMQSALAAIHDEALKAVELEMPTKSKERLMRVIGLAHPQPTETDREAIAKRLSAIREYAENALSALLLWNTAEPMRGDVKWRLDAIIAVARETVDCRSRDEKARE
jgi:hypothetical protein